MRLMLFLGSGVSYASGLPDVSEITEQILKGKWHNQSNQNFYPGEEPNPHFRSGNLVPRLQRFLTIAMETTGYKISNPTYEDYFYVAQQIDDFERQEIDNPAIFPYIQLLRKKIKELCEPTMWERSIDLKLLASKACDFIQCAVWDQLRKPIEIKGLDFISDMHKYGLDFDIATLNHDLLVERYLSDNQISYTDGFSEPDGDIRYFEPSRFDRMEDIRLYKLHGSINWFRFRRISDFYACVVGDNYEYCRDARGEWVNNISHIPRFLTGTYNKMASYGFGIIAWFQSKFFEQLNQSDIIIMSGYGWNDRGINGRLMDWILSSPNKRLILLHEKPEEKIRDQSRSAMWHRYDPLVAEGRLIPIRKWLSNTSIEDILQVLPQLKNKRGHT